MQYERKMSTLEDTVKKEFWHGCLFPDDNQWQIHFLTNTWTKWLIPPELSEGF